MRFLFIFLGQFLLAFPAAATLTLPGTDIWVMDLAARGDAVVASSPRNITQRAGYDNQPTFVTNHSLLFTSIDGGGQTDAWRIDLASGEAAPLRTTPESEYSPTPAPTGEVSVVRVDANGVQQFAVLAADAPSYEVLFPMLEGVGYYAWVDTGHVALYMVREPVSELHIANRRSGEVAVLAKDVGRCLLPVPGEPGRIAFVEAGSDGQRWIKQLDFAARRITALAPVLGNGEDFAMLPDGRLIMANGRVLHAWNGERWQEFANLENLPGDISRLAASPDGGRLALVVSEAAGK